MGHFLSDNKSDPSVNGLGQALWVSCWWVTCGSLFGWSLSVCLSLCLCFIVLLYFWGGVFSFQADRQTLFLFLICFIASCIGPQVLKDCRGQLMCAGKCARLENPNNLWPTNIHYYPLISIIRPTNIHTQAVKDAGGDLSPCGFVFVSLPLSLCLCLSFCPLCLRHFWFLRRRWCLIPLWLCLCVSVSASVSQFLSFLLPIVS